MFTFYWHCCQSPVSHFILHAYAMFTIICFVVVPHITNAIQEWVERVAKVPVDGLEGQPDVCIVEVLVIC